MDELKAKLELTDVALSRRVEISPAMLAHVRAGRRPLPPASRIRLLDALGYVMTRDLLLRLLPAELRSAIESVDNRRAEFLGVPADSDPNVGREMPPEEA